MEIIPSGLGHSLTRITYPTTLFPKYYHSTPDRIYLDTYDGIGYIWGGVTVIPEQGNT